MIFPLRVKLALLASLLLVGGIGTVSLLVLERSSEALEAEARKRGRFLAWSLAQNASAPTTHTVSAAPNRCIIWTVTNASNESTPGISPPSTARHGVNASLNAMGGHQWPRQVGKSGQTSAA